MKKEVFDYANSLFMRSKNKKEETSENLKQHKFAECISSAQECIELSIKATFTLIQSKFPKNHTFSEDDFITILNKKPKNFENINFEKMFLYSKFWTTFYTIAKYGLDKLKIGPEKLFEIEEAELALSHASFCFANATYMINYYKSKL